MGRVDQNLFPAFYPNESMFNRFMIERCRSLPNNILKSSKALRLRVHLGCRGHAFSVDALNRSETIWNIG